jgi:hypothetical protein
MDWRKNRIAIGAVAFCLLLGLTFWVIRGRNQQPGGSEELPSLELDKDAITSIEVIRPGHEPIVLSKSDGEWRVLEPLDAAADQTNVESALNRLADLRIKRVVATRPENYARLQVDDTSAVRVIVKAGDDTLTELMIGKYGNGMTMVRVDDRDEVFGASGSLRYAFDRELKGWRDRKVVNVEIDDVKSIRFESPNGTFQFERDGQSWTIAEGHAALEEFDPKQIDGIVATAARLVASDFATDEISPARAGITEPKATVTVTLAEDPNPIVLDLGDSSAESGEVYLRRRGNETLYLVSTYLADRLQPGATAFKKPEAPAAPPSAMPNPAPGGQQPAQLPPEVMRQLQEQIRAQQEQR